MERTGAYCRQEFRLPPACYTEDGRMRKVGFELEFTGIDLHRIAEIVVEVFGGRHVEESRFVHRVVDTASGNFTIEIDAAVIKNRSYEKYLEAVGVNMRDLPTRRAVEKVLDSIVSTVVPYEIVTPPFPVDGLEAVEDLRRALQAKKARGTRSSVVYAFGLHINPEAPSQDAKTLLSYLRAFLLLYGWILKTGKVDLSRRIAPFIDPFPGAYCRQVLDPAYDPDLVRLMDDYLEYNPTRYRPLDMLALFAYLDEARVRNALAGAKDVGARPAFHYRLPNCLIDEPDWTVAREWNFWVEIETLAADPDRIQRMSEAHLEATRGPSGLFGDRWADQVEAWIR